MNDGPVWRHALCFLAMACGVDCASAGPPPLQALIDAAPVGAVLRPPAGRYAGPAVIGKSLTLDGGGRSFWMAAAAARF
jgi:nitrous oxidase accessory protein NosD